ncbi:hypothetical protein PENCOP_c003G01682 [Penicillium coprophilum]|uniref:Conidiation protein 6 n=1 Tax=Penicillium coprophilum TaxID=36646 RepID=A0A1V6UXB1_9EURO|nr:hypothetical protein PENCOP_c003G01682 [Penicillium coprophilum]
MSAEDRLNAMRGYKATLSNQKVSEEAKQNAQAMLDEIGGDQPREELYEARGDKRKNPVRVSAGLKAAQHSPIITESGKQNAAEKLQERGVPEE